MSRRSFQLTPHDQLQEIALQDYKDDKDHRFYKGNAFEYPSVTTVCKVADKGPQLDAWIKRVGVAEANRLRNRGARRGSNLHKAVENYLNNDDVALAKDLTNTETFSNFFLLQPLIDRHIGSIYCFETAVFSHILETAGRLDLFATWDSEPTLVDFKTTTKRRDRKFYDTYCMQAAAYCFMLKERTGIDVRRFVLAFATDEGESFIVDGERKEHMKKFIDLRSKYREIYGR